jgi:hypothetical protein
MIEQICIRIFCKMTYFNDMIEKGIKPVIIGNLTVKISCLLHMKHRGQCGPSLTHDHEWQSEPHAKYKIIHGTFLIGNNGSSYSKHPSPLMGMSITPLNSIQGLH